MVDQAQPGGLKVRVVKYRWQCFDRFCLTVIPPYSDLYLQRLLRRRVPEIEAQTTDLHG